MPRERLSMRKIREALRLKSLGLSNRQIARSLQISPATVYDYLARARLAELGWPLPEEMDDAALETTLFPSPAPRTSLRPPPDWGTIHTELRRKHVTLRLLWEEYKSEYPDGYQYSRFCDLYKRWEGTLGVWMRQPHKAGEKLFVDYSGDGIPLVDRKTGELKEARLFVAVMGASNYTYAEATETEQLPDFLSCHVHAFEFLGGVPAVTVPDQAKTAVKKSCRYDPDLNPAYRELASHYSTCVIPARPRKPRDKAKVEVAVLIAQRWIIARLRNRTFFALGEINAAIKELLVDLNDRLMRKLGRSRKELFLALDKPELLPLPEKRYEYAQWKVGARVNLDYHVDFLKSYYSVPYQHAHKKVDIRATARMVEIFLNHNRIASHHRSRREHSYMTSREHMPRAHQKHLEWTPSRIAKWAESVGPSTAGLVERIMEERRHPEQGYRACLGILRLGKRYDKERLEKACQRALLSRGHSYHSVESILKNKLEDQPLPERNDQALPSHENVRGNEYYNYN